VQLARLDGEIDAAQDLQRSEPLPDVRHPEAGGTPLDFGRDYFPPVNHFG
jgi:hypothetical protein